MSLGEHSSQDTLGQLQGKGDNYTKLSIIEKKKLIGVTFCIFIFNCYQTNKCLYYVDLQDAIGYVDSQTGSYYTQFVSLS